MLERRQRGEDPGSSSSWSSSATSSPRTRRTLDELLEQIARAMAAMQAMLNSMSPEQRAQLQQLAEQLLGDMDLRWQLDQLGSNLRGMFPQMNWGQSYDFDGQDPMGMPQAMQAMQELGDLDQLEHLLQSATNPAALAEADMDTRARSARRRRRPLARAAEPAHQDARGGRADREQARGASS